MSRRALGVTAIMAGLCVSSSAVAAEVPLDRARQVAQNWLSHALAADKPSNRAQYKIVQEEVLQVEGKTVGYNFVLYPTGHIVVPSRDELPVVKMYSLTSRLSAAENPEVLEWIKRGLFDVNREIEENPGYLLKTKGTTSRNGRLWSQFAAAPSSFKAEAAQVASAEPTFSLGPLLSTHWHQFPPYNMYAPPWCGEHAFAGCTATAAAQILKYWNWPDVAQNPDSASYYVPAHSCYLWGPNVPGDPPLTMYFSSGPYDWPNMVNEYEQGNWTALQAQAVARLISDVFIVLHPWWIAYYPNGGAPSATSALPDPAIYSTYFKYKVAQQVAPATESEWMQVFKNEVQHLRPSQLYLMPSDYSFNDHIVVVDGYRNTSGEQVHINMGWRNANYNAWYAANGLPGGSGWTYFLYQAIIGIEPNNTNNRPPVVDAGDNQTVTWPAAANLAGTVGDDDRPIPHESVTVEWSKVSGPGDVTFATPNAAATEARFSASGTYVLRLTANDTQLSGSDEVTITVQGPCAELCSDPVQFSIPPGRDYQGGNLGTGAVCYETTSDIAGGNCGNFAGSRTLSVNGTPEVCNYQNWASVPARRNGGYCIQTTAGDYSWAYFAVWRNAATPDDCLAAGGRVDTAMCCRTAGNFPNTCLLGSCGCTSGNSHQVQVCLCPGGQCWDGAACVGG